MFDFLRRLFGLARPGEAAPGTVAMMAVTGTGRNNGNRASSPARLVARDNGGTSLLSCRVEVGTGRNLAAPPGFTGTADDFPEGDYLLEEVSPAAADGFGPHPVLRLAARVGENAPPPEHGRPALLIGGFPPGPLADGAIRMDDADLAQLLALLPEDLGQVLVRLVRPLDVDADSDSSTSDRDPWFGHESRGSGEGAGEGSGEGGAAAAPAADTGPTTADQAAAAALAGLGYAVLSEQAVPGGKAEAAAAVAASEAATTNDPDPGWTPAGGEYGR